MSKLHPIKMTFFQSDGSLDEAVMGAAVGTIAVITFQAYDLFHLHNPFNAVAFGMAIGSIWTGAGALMRLRPQLPLPPSPPQV